MRTSAPGQSALLMADVAEFLTTQGVRYAVIGAMAAAVHGVVRASLDADAVVALQVREAQALRQSLVEAGYEVVETEPPNAVETGNLWLSVVVAELRTLIAPAIWPLISADSQTFLDLVFGAMPPTDLTDYMGALAVRNTYARQWSLFFAEYDLVLGPVCTMQPFEPGFDLASSENVMQIGAALRLVVTCGLLGLPAAVVPVGVADGLPQSAQVIGPRFMEDTCLDAAEAIEAALGCITPIDPVG